MWLLWSVLSAHQQWQDDKTCWEVFSNYKSTQIPSGLVTRGWWVHTETEKPTWSKIYINTIYNKSKDVRNDKWRQCVPNSIKFKLCNHRMNFLKWWYGLHGSVTLKAMLVRPPKPVRERVRQRIVPEPLDSSLMWGAIKPTTTPWLHRSYFMGTHHSAILSLTAGLKGNGLLVCFCSSPMAL
jgi:hypothetical protein